MKTDYILNQKRFNPGVATLVKIIFGESEYPRC